MLYLNLLCGCGLMIVFNLLLINKYKFYRCKILNIILKNDLSLLEEMNKNHKNFDLNHLLIDSKKMNSSWVSNSANSKLVRGLFLKKINEIYNLKFNYENLRDVLFEIKLDKVKSDRLLRQNLSLGIKNNSLNKNKPLKFDEFYNKIARLEIDKSVNNIVSDWRGFQKFDSVTSSLLSVLEK